MQTLASQVYKQIEIAFLGQRSASMLLVTSAHSLITALIFFTQNDLHIRSTMKMFISLAPAWAWGLMWLALGVSQLIVNSEDERIPFKLRYGINTLVAGVNIAVWSAILYALWPALPALLGGQTAVMLASIVLYLKTDRRCGRTRKGSYARSEKS